MRPSFETAGGATRFSTSSKKATESPSKLRTLRSPAFSATCSAKKQRCQWDDREVVVSMMREFSGECWVAIDGGVFNASEAKALIAALASCVASIEAKKGGDGDDGH